MAESSFGKKTVYQSDLVGAGKIEVLITSEPQKSKFKKEGQHGYWLGFKHKGKEQQLIIENQTVHDKLKGLKGHVVELTASGSRDDADIEIFDAAGPASEKTRETRAAQPPPKNGAPPDTDTLKAAKRSLMQHINAQLLAMEAVVFMSDEWDKRHPETPFNETMFEHFASNFYIGLDRKGLIDGLPYKIEPHHAPKPETKPEPKPAPPVPDDDDFPL